MKALKPRGFTLIEILISLTIMVLVFGVGFAGYRDFSQGQSLEKAARELRTNLRLAQSIALSGTKPNPPDSRCESPNVFNGVFFSASQGANAYGISYSCSGGGVNINNASAFVSLGSQGIDLTRTGPYSFIFKSLGQGTTLPEGTEVVLTLTQVSTGKSVSVVVTASGEIK